MKNQEHGVGREREREREKEREIEGKTEPFEVTSCSTVKLVSGTEAIRASQSIWEKAI